MTFIKHFIGIFILLNIFLPNSRVIAQQTNYVPPSSDRYTQQTRSQASRNPTRKPIDFETLAPSEYIAATFSGKPVFYLIFIKSWGIFVSMSLLRPLMKKSFILKQLSVNHTGIFSLPIAGSLPEGRCILPMATSLVTVRGSELSSITKI